MLKTLLSQLLLVTALATLTETAHAAPPPGMTTFTARLGDANGPLTGSHNFAFGLYTAPTGGSAVWTETQNNVVLEQGVASIPLGSTTPLTTTLFDGSTMYLEVIVDGSVLDERVPIYSVPYALRANVAETAQVANSLSASLEAQLDAAYQAPLTAGCSAGQFLTNFSAGGLASCSADGKGVAAVDGGLVGMLVGNNIELAIAMNAISSKHILDNSIASADIANGSIVSEDIETGAINSQTIKDGSVAAIDITDGAIETAKLADGAVDGAKVLDGSLTGADIQNGSIGSADIGADSVGASHLLANSVSSSEIVDASITSAELANNACDLNQIAANAVTGAKIADNAVGASEVINNSLGGDEVDLVMFTSVGAGVTLASGTNDIFVPATYVATTTGSCMVTATGRMTNAGASATGGVAMRIVWRTVGGVTVPDNAIAPMAGQYPGGGQTHVTKAHVVPVNGGSTYEFGCRLSTSGDWVGDTGECQVTVFCQ